RRRWHTRLASGWSSDVCSSDLRPQPPTFQDPGLHRRRSHICHEPSDDVLMIKYETVGGADRGLERLEAEGAEGKGQALESGVDRSEERRVGKEGRAA